LTITFTRTENGRGTTFKVGGNGEAEKCFDPGRYTYTIDAPPPWNSINGELTVQAGDAFLFPISGE
jgi:serine protease Do